MRRLRTPIRAPQTGCSGGSRTPGVTGAAAFPGTQWAAGGREGVPTLPSFYFGGHFQEGFSPMDFSVGPCLTAFPPGQLLRVSCCLGSCAEQVNKYFWISRWDSVCHEVPHKFRLEKLRRKAIRRKFGGALTWVVSMSLTTLVQVQH